MPPRPSLNPRPETARRHPYQSGETKFSQLVAGSPYLQTIHQELLKGRSRGTESDMFASATWPRAVTTEQEPQYRNSTPNSNYRRPLSLLTTRCYRYKVGLSETLLISSVPTSILLSLPSASLAPSQAHVAPSVSNALRSSLTAVGTSSKFKAEIAHLACFCAFAIARSSVM